MTYTSILTETRGRVGIVTLNRPQALNAFNLTLLGEVFDALEAFDREESILAIVVTEVAADYAELLVPTNDPGEVLVDHERVEDVTHHLLPLGAELTHDPEIEEAGPTVLECPDGACMQVPMERTVDGHRLHPGLHSLTEV